MFAICFCLFTIKLSKPLSWTSQFWSKSSLRPSGKSQTACCQGNLSQCRVNCGSISRISTSWKGLAQTHLIWDFCSHLAPWMPLSAMPGGILNFCVGMMFEAYFPASVLSLQTIRMGKKSIALQVNEISPLSVDLTRAWTLSSLENVSANKQSTFNAFFFKSKKEPHFLLVPRKPQLFFLNVCGSSKFSLAVFSEESCKPQDLSSKDILNLFWTTLRAHFLCPTCAWFGMLEDFVI